MGHLIISGAHLTDECKLLSEIPLSPPFSVSTGGHDVVPPRDEKYRCVEAARRLLRARSILAQPCGHRRRRGRKKKRKNLVRRTREQRSLREL